MNPRAELYSLVQALLPHLQKGPVYLFPEEQSPLFLQEPQKLAPSTPLPKPLPPPKPLTFAPPPPKKEPLPSPTPPPSIPLSPKKVPFSHWREVLAKVTPQTHWIETILPDDLAKKEANKWQAKTLVSPYSILSFQEPPHQKQLLQNIAHAIDTMLHPAHFLDATELEKEDQWEAFLTDPVLQKVFICDSTLFQLKKLLRFYKELPTKSQRMLGNVPVFLFPDLHLYEKDPHLKKALWHAIAYG